MKKTLTPISKITNIYKNIEDRETKAISNLTKNIYHKRLFLRLHAKEFNNLVRLKGERIFREAGDDIKFEIDDYNRENLNQIFYYSVGSKKFNGDLKKGLWLWSSEFGTGKTTVLMILKELFNEFNETHFPFINCKLLDEIYLSKGIKYFAKRIIYFDDILREQKEINDFGNKINPIPSIFHIRDLYGSWTHATCQLPIEELNKYYGKVTTDRMIKKFNQIEFKGKSRRK